MTDKTLIVMTTDELCTAPMILRGYKILNNIPFGGTEFGPSRQFLTGVGEAAKLVAKTLRAAVSVAFRAGVEAGVVVLVDEGRSNGKDEE